jgi:DNA-directed RNA polymerase specialized sigma24 family protein
VELSLQEVLRVQDPREQNTLLERLFSSQIEPLIKKTVRIRFSSIRAARQDEEDVCSETSLRLWKQMQKWMRTPDTMDVADIPAYIATTTSNSYKEYLRKKYPRRWHLRNRLRYLFTHSDQFKIWKADTGEWLCGFASWQGKQQLNNVQQKRVTEIVQATPAKQLSRVVATALQAAEGPLVLDNLLSIVIETPGIREQFQDLQVDHDSELNRLADPQSNKEADSQHKTYLKHLWSEICSLPVKQRVALLLNLRDREGRDAIMSFPATGTASIRDIANAMNMPIEEFAALWNDLPMDDIRIAQRLQLTRQQVINLRKSARERLSYRMRKIRGVI